MARFVLIDHSVTSPGGHNFEHANDVLAAAEASGFEPVLAANQSVAGNAAFPSSWRVLPLFPDEWDPAHWIGPDGRSHHPFDVDGCLLPPEAGDMRPRGLLPQAAHWMSRARDALRQRDRRRYMLRFAEACARLWDTVRPTAEDRIFLPSVTEFDLLGLIRFLKSEPESQRVAWHLLFHFNLFDGRTPSYARQKQTRDRFRRQFTAALAHVPEHRLRFYGITNLLAEQYNRLQTVTFSELPYTINNSIQVIAGMENHRPLRLACPGVIRREKGKRQIRNLVRRLWSEHLASGEAQLFFQGQSRDLRRFFPKETLAHSTYLDTPGIPTEAPIVVVRHPLSASEYAQLIRNSHVGIFLHDSERYFARCSGTLVELLGAGVPVIVPAGCWLAEQIAEPIYRHLDQLLASDAVVATHGVEELKWVLPERTTVDDRPAHRFHCGGFYCGGTKRPARCAMTVPREAVNAIVSWIPAPGTQSGHYVRVEVDQYDMAGTGVAARQTSIIGMRSAGECISTLFTVNARTATLRVTVTNAYGTTLLAASDVRVAMLSRDDRHPGTFPGGQVGLIAADLSEYSRLLRDMTDHYPHYRRSAVEFARVWSRVHSAHAVIQRIDQASRSPATASTRGAA